MKFSIVIFDIYCCMGKNNIASLSLVFNCNVMNHTEMVSACITMDYYSNVRLICMLICLINLFKDYLHVRSSRDTLILQEKNCR